ncbi:ferredoxin family protein [Chloroflexota bacterium]
MPPIVNKETCTKCGLCASICPMDVFKWNKGEYPIVRYPEECWHCNACSLDCPVKSIELRIPLPASTLYYLTRT